MRKLTVKNFSVIKDAELEFGKITVLIGPQSSGKSLLCKLAYFLSKQAIDSALEFVLNGESFESFKVELARRFIDWFPIHTWSSDGSSVNLESGDFSVKATLGVGEASAAIDFLFSLQFEQVFLQLTSLEHNGVQLDSDFSADRREQIRAKFNLLLSDSLQKDPYVHQSQYIPGGRVFFVNRSLETSVLENRDIEPLIREFSSKVAWGDAWKPNPVIGVDALERLESIRQDIFDIAGGQIVGRGMSARFFRSSDRREIPLTRLSSGTQELLPFLNVVEQMISRQRDRIIFPRPNSLPGMQGLLILSKALIYFEEPEANIFPSTQFELVRLLAKLSSEPILDFSWVITTHSPYLLSSFNNLIEAGQVVRDHPELRDEVAKIVPEQYWIKDGDFKAYSIHDGKLEPILNESGFIEGNYLDQVSDVIEKEFDQLLRLEYDHSEAS